jgi:hypothetical protein
VSETNKTIVEIRHGFSSMGTSVHHKTGEHEYCFGLPIDALGFECGNGDRFLVTVERLPRNPSVPRWPKNPWKDPERPRKKAKTRKR